MPLPSPCHFFRVHEGLVLVPVAVPVRIASITMSTNGVLLAWTTPASNQFQVQWTASLCPPAWNTFTNLLTRPTALLRSSTMAPNPAAWTARATIGCSR